MRRFSLVGLALVLLAGSASAQQVVNVTTTREFRTKTTVIERVGPGVPYAPGLPFAPGLPTLDQLTQKPLHPVCSPKSPLCGLLADQPALLYRLGLMNAVPMGGVGVGAYGPLPKLDELPRSTLRDEKPIVDDKKIDDKKVEGPAPATMITLDAKDWYDGRCFTDAAGRRWCLLKGCPLSDKLPRMRGWVLESDGKKLYFLHETGNIYTRVVPLLP